MDCESGESMAKDEVACRCREKSGGRETGAVAFLPALGPWAPPAKRGPSLESIYRVSLTVDLCEGNKIISFKKFTSPQPVGAPQKEKKSGALGTCPVCPLVKTALDWFEDDGDKPGVGQTKIVRRILVRGRSVPRCRLRRIKF